MKNYLNIATLAERLQIRRSTLYAWVQAGVDLYSVQRLGRWKSIKMVQHYGHHYPESLRGEVEMLDRGGAASTIRAQSVGRATAATA